MRGCFLHSLLGGVSQDNMARRQPCADAFVIYRKEVPIHIWVAPETSGDSLCIGQMTDLLYLHLMREICSGKTYHMCPKYICVIYLVHVAGWGVSK